MLAFAVVLSVSASALHAASAPKQVPEGCLDPAVHGDVDVRANLTKISRGGLCFTKETISDPAGVIRLQIITNPSRTNGPIWVVPHDDEQSAFDAAVYAALAYGGGFVAVENGERRKLPGGRDPNRLFGTDKTVCKAGHRPSSSLTRAIMKLAANPSGVYLALHSNRNGKDGGISAHVGQAGTLTGLPTLSPVNTALGDGDNAILFAGRTSAKGAEVMRLAGDLNSQGVNVIYEQVTRTGNDCSLSNYLVAERNVKVGLYFNIEAEHCRTSAQIQLVDVLLTSLGFQRHNNATWLSASPKCKR